MKSEEEIDEGEREEKERGGGWRTLHSSAILCNAICLGVLGLL